jgi:hypothetical protein
MRNTITVTFNSDRPLTGTEQDAILTQIELALTEPQDYILAEDGTVMDTESADWRLAGDIDLEATFPLV